MHNHFFTVSIVEEFRLVVNSKGVGDGRDWYYEGCLANRKPHSIDDGEGKRNLDGKLGAFPFLLSTITEPLSFSMLRTTTSMPTPRPETH